METVYVYRGNSPGGSGLTPSTNPVDPDRAFGSWHEAHVPKQGLTLSQDYHVVLMGSGPDTVALTQTSWNIQTPPGTKIWAEVHPAWRMSNVAVPSSGYYMQIQDSSAVYNNQASQVLLEHIPIILLGTTSDGIFNYNAFRLATANNIGSSVNHKFHNCFTRLIQLGTDKCYGFQDSDPITAGSVGTCVRMNCIVFMEDIEGHPATSYAYGGFVSDGSSWAASNVRNYNTIACGVQIPYLDVQLCKNTVGMVARLGAGAYLSTGSSGHEYNAADDGSAQGTNALNAIVPSACYNDVTVGDFNLKITSPLLGTGKTDPSSGLFSDDFLGRSRVIPWSRGASDIIASLSGLGGGAWSSLSALSGLSGGGRR